MLHRYFLAATLAGSLCVAGCSGGSTPAATPTTSVTTNVTTSETSTPATTGTPGEAVSGTPGEAASGTPEVSATDPTGTPGSEETLDPAYVKLRDEGVNPALGKGYAEAVPALQKALEVNPDDPDVHFYLMLSQGNLEETPSPKSEAYSHAKKVLELAPGSTMAERARDYVLSAESEPPKELPNLDAPSLASTREWVFKTNAIYTLPVKAFMISNTRPELGEDLKKQLWYLEVVPQSVADKIELSKGTTFSIREIDEYMYSKLSWRGNMERSLAKGEFDSNAFKLAAFSIEVESGPQKGKHGWLINQMDRFLGVDDNDKPVWGVQVLKLPLPRK